jgi:hypothetical protein
MSLVVLAWSVAVNGATTDSRLKAMSWTKNTVHDRHSAVLLQIKGVSAAACIWLIASLELGQKRSTDPCWQSKTGVDCLTVVGDTPASACDKQAVCDPCVRCLLVLYLTQEWLVYIQRFCSAAFDSI